MSTDPAPRRRRQPLLLLGLGLVLAAGTAACGTPEAPRTSTQPPLGYRRLPSYLPTSVPVDQVLTASQSHPQLAVQGIGVRVLLPGGRALMTVTGPRVPPFTAPPPPQVTATFTVTLTHVSGSIPLRPADFTVDDQLGRTFHPVLPVGARSIPPTVSAGRTVEFHLTAVMPTGEGRIYWAPSRNTRIVGWDFIVEND